MDSNASGPWTMLGAARSLAFAPQRLRAGAEPSSWGLWAAAIDRHLAAAVGVQARWALLAVGGYGRRELCPSSDIDVLVLVDDVEPEPAAVTTWFSPLWDLGLQVGHRVGRVQQLLDQSEADPHLRTALLCTRVVAGEAAMAAPLLRGIDERRPSWFAALDEWRLEDEVRRRLRHGPSPSMLEPNLKEGLGGLRDLHWLRWLAHCRFGTQRWEDLVVVGAIEADHVAELVAASTILLRARCAVHLHHRRPVDKVRAEDRAAYASTVGERGAGGADAGDRLLRHLLGSMVRVRHLLDLYVARWASGTADRGASSLSEVEAHPSDDPASLIRALGAGTLDASATSVERHSATVGDRRWKHPDCHRAFRMALQGPHAAALVRHLWAAGVIECWIPEAREARHRPQRSRAHLYAVDEHILRCVGALDRFDSDDGFADCAPAAEAWRASERRGPVRMAAFLHDVAKHLGTAHSRIGAEIAERRLPELGYEPEEVARIAWLVRHHLVLAETAQHRDLHDPHTRAALAAVLPDGGHLDDLLVLTVADAIATQPAGWTSWRRVMVEDAYRAARTALAPASNPAPEEHGILARVEALLVPELGHRRAPAVTAALPAALDRPLGDAFARDGAEGLAIQALLLDRAHSGDGGPLWTHRRPRRDAGWTEWLAVCADRKGLFCDLAGAAAASGFSILSADVRTLAGGFALDTFLLCDDQGRIVEDEGRWRRLERLSQRVLAGQERPGPLVDAARRSAAPPRAAAPDDRRDVRADNDLSATATVIEVRWPDRLGLVFTVARALRTHDLDLRHARITTRSAQATDTFYVVDARGRKLSARKRGLVVRSLIDALRSLDSSVTA